MGHSVDEPNCTDRIRRLTVYEDDPVSGMTSFAAHAASRGVSAVARVVLDPKQLTELIDFLITTYNRYVDEGLVDTDKYPDPFSR